jgi:hypothetical protein
LDTAVAALALASVAATLSVAACLADGTAAAAVAALAFAAAALPIAACFARGTAAAVVPPLGRREAAGAGRHDLTSWAAAVIPERLVAAACCATKGAAKSSRCVDCAGTEGGAVAATYFPLTP